MVVLVAGRPARAATTPSRARRAVDVQLVDREHAAGHDQLRQPGARLLERLHVVQRDDGERGVVAPLCVDQRRALDAPAGLGLRVDRGDRVAASRSAAASSPSPAPISSTRAGGGGSAPRAKARTPGSTIAGRYRARACHGRSRCCAESTSPPATGSRCPTSGGARRGGLRGCRHARAERQHRAHLGEEAEDVEREISKLVHDEFGVESATVVRTRDELAAVIERNPIPAGPSIPKLFQVTFFSAEPDTGGWRSCSTRTSAMRAGRGHRPRGLRLAPGRHPEVQARPRARQGPARRRHRPQLEHRHQAAGARRLGVANFER